MKERLEHENQPFNAHVAAFPKNKMDLGEVTVVFVVKQTRHNKGKTGLSLELES